eukprot:1176351-Prorocentrum_minimum.AAC.9
MGEGSGQGLTFPELRSRQACVSQLPQKPVPFVRTRFPEDLRVSGFAACQEVWVLHFVSKQQSMAGSQASLHAVRWQPAWKSHIEYRMSYIAAQHPLLSFVYLSSRSSS